MIKILIVDDSRMIRDLFTRCLEGPDTIVKAWEPEEVLEIQPMILDFKPDLLFLDYQMPTCNGITFARLARTTRPKMKILLISASHDRDLFRHLEKGVVDDVVFKPLSKTDLLALVAKHTEESRMGWIPRPLPNDPP